MMPDPSIRTSQKFLIDMDTDTHLCVLELTLVPVGHMPPKVTVFLDTQVVYSDALTREEILLHTVSLPTGQHCLRIDFSDKPDHDQQQAVKIERLAFNGLSDQQFIWRGIYRPEYPEPWFSQQIQLGRVPEPAITNTDYMGWNGTWSLEITSPIFTWIHRTQDLGWIYD